MYKCYKLVINVLQKPFCNIWQQYIVSIYCDALIHFVCHRWTATGDLILTMFDFILTFEQRPTLTSLFVFSRSFLLDVNTCVNSYLAQISCHGWFKMEYAWSDLNFWAKVKLDITIEFFIYLFFRVYVYCKTIDNINIDASTWILNEKINDPFNTYIRQLFVCIRIAYFANIAWRA